CALHEPRNCRAGRKHHTGRERGRGHGPQRISRHGVSTLLALERGTRPYQLARYAAVPSVARAETVRDEQSSSRPVSEEDAVSATATAKPLTDPGTRPVPEPAAPGEDEGGRFRRRLLDGLAASIADKGYRATTVADIVRRARTSRRTFYEHFAGKEECFIALLSDT